MKKKQTEQEKSRTIIISQRLTELRKEKRKTREQVVEEIGEICDRHNISRFTKLTLLRWENGENQIPLHKVGTLAEYYKVREEYILGIDDFKTYQDVEDSNINPNIVQKVSSIKKIIEQGQESPEYVKNQERAETIIAYLLFWKNKGRMCMSDESNEYFIQINDIEFTLDKSLLQSEIINPIFEYYESLLYKYSSTIKRQTDGTIQTLKSINGLKANYINKKGKNNNEQSNTKQKK